jgi:hypothetical protein
VIDALQRRDPLLEDAHLVGQVGLVADLRRHPTQQGRHLGAGLGEPEDVVDEQQHVLVLDVTEVLRHGQRRQGDTKADPWGLVHLAEDQSRLVDDPGVLHLEEEVVALAGAFADSGEHRHTTVLGGDPVDHLLDQHRLAHAGTAEQADLAALEIGADQVEHLDPGLEDLLLRLDVLERRGVRWIGQRGSPKS